MSSSRKTLGKTPESQKSALTQPRTSLGKVWKTYALKDPNEDAYFNRGILTLGDESASRCRGLNTSLYTWLSSSPSHSPPRSSSLPLALFLAGRQERNAEGPQWHAIGTLGCDSKCTARKQPYRSCGCVKNECSRWHATCGPHKNNLRSHPRGTRSFPGVS